MPRVWNLVKKETLFFITFKEEPKNLTEFKFRSQHDRKIVY